MIRGLNGSDLTVASQPRGAKVDLHGRAAPGTARHPHAARSQHLTAHPTGAWTVQQVRNPAIDLRKRIAGLRFLIHHRDSLFTSAFREVFKAEVIMTPRMTGS
ncbi:hypothetical protein [Nonomuraea sp. B19D2]|uniref:hypothetical protein n=1 Tax=Nonomuraea sp. B19D2 TaxID=3159561 RepID=UPI0032DB6602